MSDSYLSDLLKLETGRSARDHINSHLLEKAKNTLLNSTSSISDIAYNEGFDYPQYFNKYFKSNTGSNSTKSRSLN